MSTSSTLRTVRTKPVSPVDKMFRAFADRTRLRILHLLQGGELCVSDLITILKVPQAKASHHLNYLRRAGLVDARKQGLWCFYSLRPAETVFHQKLLECLGQCFSDVPGLAGDRQRAAKVKASGGCCPKCGPPSERTTGRTTERHRRNWAVLRARVVAVLFLATGLLTPDAQASPQDDLTSAAEHQKVAFVLVTEPGTMGMDSARDLLRQAMQQVEKSTLIEVDRARPENAELVAKCRLSGVPVPFVLVTARDGTLGGGMVAAQATSERLVALVPSPRKAEVLRALRSGRAVLLSVNRVEMDGRLEAEMACAAACVQLPGKCVAIRVDLDDPQEAGYCSALKVDLAATEPLTLVVNAQGEVTGRFPGTVDVASLVSAATKQSASCCPPGSGKSCGPAAACPSGPAPAEAE